jgi:hypothetical protein
MFPIRKPICPAVLDQTPGRGVFSAQSTLANDPWPRKALGLVFALALHRAIATAELTRWDEKAGLQRDAIRSQ